MNEKRIARVLLRLAKEMADNDWLTADEVEEICPACAAKMRRQKVNRIRASIIKKALAKSKKSKE